MGKITTVGIDLAKNVFSVHAVDETGQVVLRKTITRARLMATVAQWPLCVIGMEACSGAHDWARRFQALGHGVRIMAARFVTPYRRNGKNDGNDAEAICEAMQRPSMRFVPLKSAEQQAVLTVHRVRQGFVEERTAVINRVRGLLAEFGKVLPQRADEVRRGAAVAADELPVLARDAIADLLRHLNALDEQIAAYDHQLKRLAASSEATQRLMGVPGVGPLTALATVASVGHAHEFASGRQFAAWLGLVPRQWSTGGKTRLGRITKRGDAYLRTLLIMGARSALQMAAGRTDKLSRWAMTLKERRGYHKAVVALAAKNARIIWAILARGTQFNPA
jgi:transposase